MSNPLLLFWYRLFAPEPVRRPPRWRVPLSTSRQASETIFLVMRRMRAPLIVLIVIFAISTVGLTRSPIAADDDILLAPDDELLFVGWPSAHRLLDATLLVDATREYVVHGRHVPSSWVWRKLTRRPA